MISYIPLFPAFLKLRKTNKTERVYKVPGNSFVLGLVTYVPLILLVLGVVFTLFIDFTKESIMANLPLIIGVVISVIIQEILAFFVKEDKNKKKA